VLSSVALGEVGIVGSWEVSRLSRTDKDWCRLLEVCQIFGTLIADEQHVYDLNSLDDQLVLGIKGTLSVIELKVLRQRMQAGQKSKARRGELFKRLPVGYVLDAMNQVAFDPDQRVREALQFVFVKFRQLWSVRQTFQWFRDHDIDLPANPIEGTGLVWKIPSQSFVRDVLCNPFYAGAYVWGRRPVAMVLVDGRLEKRQTALQRAEECRVFIRDHHIGYIDWATYEENQRMIRRNSINWPGDESMAAIRVGQGLLVGLLRCGHCGRKLHVRYWGGRGINARYLCKGDYDDGGQYCIGFGGASVDRRVGQEVLKVISPPKDDMHMRVIRVSVYHGCPFQWRTYVLPDGRHHLARQPFQIQAFAELRRKHELEKALVTGPLPPRQGPRDIHWLHGTECLRAVPPQGGGTVPHEISSVGCPLPARLSSYIS
jgi:hypothetical protein